MDPRQVTTMANKFQAVLDEEVLNRDYQDLLESHASGVLP
jgi:hypothetical protein